MHKNRANLRRKRNTVRILSQLTPNVRSITRIYFHLSWLLCARWNKIKMRKLVSN